MGVFTRNPDATPAASLPYAAHRPITAAAQKLNVANKQELELVNRRRASSKWQNEAWEYYDAIGEVKYAFKLFSNVMSRIRLYAGVVENEDAPPSPIRASDLDDTIKAAASKAMQRVFSGATTSEILRKAAVNILVAGECYLVQLPPKIGLRETERWRIISIDELVTKNGRMYIKTRRDQRDSELEEIPATAFVGRVWNEHARYSDEADSSMRALVDLCLAEGSLVYGDGKAWRIENTREGDLVWSFDENSGSLVLKPVTRVLSQGAKPVFKLRTRRRELRATGNHPMLVFRNERGKTNRKWGNYWLEWVNVEDLSPGDILVAPDTTPETGNASQQHLPDGTAVDEDVAWLLGQIIGDGCTTRDMLYVATFNEQTTKRITDIVTTRWDVHRYEHASAANYARFNSRSWMHTVWEPMNIVGVKSGDRTIPDVIWNSPPKIQEAFLDGYEQADGYRQKKREITTYGATSKDLVVELRALNIILGHAVSNVSTEARDSYQILNQKPGIGAQDLHRFDVYRKNARPGKTWFGKSKKVRELVREDTFSFETVLSVFPDGEAQTYDLTVDDTHNFVADGLIVHNCDELFLFSRAGRATARSRLNAGALFVPDQLSVAADAPTDAMDPANPDQMLPLDDEGDEFERELMDAMTTPILDESSAASVVPLLIRGPADIGDKIKLIKFERSFDPQMAQRADRALERILQGIDLPKDIVTGLANIKYSNAIQIEESLYTAHIEPLVLMLCDAFRQVYLVPALRREGVPESVIDSIVIWYDPSAIMTAPDKSAAANVGFDKMALSYKAWRRSSGFAETDAPDALEIAQRIAIQRGQLNDAVTEALLKTLIPDVMSDARAESIANSPSPLPPGVQEVLDPNAAPVDPAATPPTTPEGLDGNQEPPPIVPGT